MKKALPLFAALVLFFAAGCEKQSINQNTPPPPPSSFTATLAVDFCGTEMKAEITQKNFDEYEIQMISPEIMAPLKIVFSNGECTAFYDGLEFRTEANRFPQSEFGSLLTQALTYVGQNIDIQKTFDGNIWTYKGVGTRGEFSLEQNPKNGEWIGFTVQSADLKVVFTNTNRK